MKRTVNESIKEKNVNDVSVIPPCGKMIFISLLFRFTREIAIN